MSLKIKNIPEEVTLDDGRVVKVKSLSAYEHGEIIASIDDGRSRAELSALAIENAVARASIEIDKDVESSVDPRLGQVASIDFMKTLSRKDISKIASKACSRLDLEKAVPNSLPTPPGSKE